MKKVTGTLLGLAVALAAIAFWRVAEDNAQLERTLAQSVELLRTTESRLARFTAGSLQQEMTALDRKEKIVDLHSIREACVTVDGIKTPFRLKIRTQVRIARVGREMQLQVVSAQAVQEMTDASDHQQLVGSCN